MLNFFNGVKKTKRLHKWIWHKHDCDWYWEQVKLEVKLILLRNKVQQ